MSTTGSREIEIKLAVPGALAEVEARLLSRGFTVSKARVFESNVVFDTEDNRLRGAGELIRVRRVGQSGLLTYKGPPSAAKYKSREEIESEVANPEKLEAILERLGLRATFRYEKFRTEYQKSGSDGTITADETPIGAFLEIEGQPGWIDETAKTLGFREKEYITKSYASLYLAYCEQQGITPTNMVFQS